MDNNIQECLEELLTLKGARGVAVVEWTTATLIASLSKDGSDLIERSALGDGEVVLSKVAVMGSVERMDAIEDIVFTLENQYHIMRLLRSHPACFLYAIFDRPEANLAQLKARLADLEELLILEEVEQGPPTL